MLLLILAGKIEERGIIRAVRCKLSVRPTLITLHTLWLRVDVQCKEFCVVPLFKVVAADRVDKWLQA